MDPERKKQVMIGLIVLCLVAAVVITIATWGGDTIAPGPSGPVQMLCTAPQCGKAFEVSREDFNQARAPKAHPDNPETLVRPTGLLILTCPHCDQKAGRVAMKCKECSKVFIGGYGPGDKYPDRCPACGYSDREARTPK